MRKDEYLFGEDELVKSFAIGDQKSFSIIFENLYPAICYFTCQITDNQSAAEDIANDCFVKVWNRRNRFTGFTSLKSFLYKTARNAAIDWLRSEARRRVGQQDLSKRGSNNDKTILENMIQSEVFREVFTALDKLPPQCRKVVRMFYVEGKPVRQIATELQVAIGTVKNQKRRGIELLKKHLPGLILIVAALQQLQFIL